MKTYNIQLSKNLDANYEIGINDIVTIMVT